MDGFTGFKTATTEELPDVVAVMDPFHVVRLASDAWTVVAAASSRTCTVTAASPATRSTAPGGTLHTGSDLLTNRQRQRLSALFGVEDHVQVEATWGVYQRMIAAYREPDWTRGRHLMR